MNFEKFETLTGKLIARDLKKQLGNKVKVEVFPKQKYKSPSGNEYEIDVSFIVKMLGIDYLTLVECKCWNQKVGRDKVATLKATLDDIGAQQAIIVSTVGFQKGAIRFAKSKKIALFLIQNNKLVVILFVDIQDYLEQFLLDYYNLNTNSQRICYN